MQELRDFQKELDSADFYFGLNLENLTYLLQDDGVAKDILIEFAPKVLPDGDEPVVNSLALLSAIAIICCLNENLHVRLITSSEKQTVKIRSTSACSPARPPVHPHARMHARTHQCMHASTHPSTHASMHAPTLCRYRKPLLLFSRSTTFASQTGDLVSTPCDAFRLRTT